MNRRSFTIESRQRQQGGAEIGIHPFLVAVPFVASGCARTSTVPVPVGTGMQKARVLEALRLRKGSTVSSTTINSTCADCPVNCSIRSTAHSTIHSPARWRWGTRRAVHARATGSSPGTPGLSSSTQCSLSKRKGERRRGSGRWSSSPGNRARGAGLLRRSTSEDRPPLFVPGLSIPFAGPSPDVSRDGLVTWSVV